jgi:hypothetical protein
VSGPVSKHELPSGARTARRWVGLCGGILLALATPLFLVNGILNHRAAVELDRARDRLRESGGALHLDDMRLPPARPEENAAPLYNRAFMAMTAPVSSDVRAALDFDLEPAATPEAIDAWLATQKPAVDDFLVAARLPRCDWQLDYTSPFTIPLPHLMKLREATKLLRLVAIRQAERGDGDAAVATTIAMLGMKQGMEEDPFLISHLVRIACDNDTYKGLGRVLEGRPSERACRELIEALDAHRPAGELARTLAAERALGLDLFEKLRDGKKPDFGGGAEEEQLVRYARARRLLPWLLDRDEAAYIEVMSDSIAAAANAGKRSSLGEGARIAARVQASDSRLAALRQVMQMLTPATSHALENEVTIEGVRASARAAAAIALFRARHGKLPDRIEELVPEVLPEVPRDPWTDAPLVYKREGNGFVVYSVGKNLFDDGGPLEPEDAKGAPARDDEGVRVR